MSPILFALALTISGCIKGIPVTVDDVGADQHDGAAETNDGRIPDRALDAAASDGSGMVDGASPDLTQDTTADSAAHPAPPAVSLCARGWCLEGTNEHGWPAFDLQAVWASSPTDVVVTAKGGKILRFDGTTWTADISPVSVDLTSVHGASATDIFAVGAEGTIVHYNGSSWSEHAYSGTLGSVSFNDVYSWAPGEFVAGGSDGYVAWWATGDFVDYVDFVDGPDIRAVAGTSATDLVAGGNGGKFYTCTDGVNWVEKSSQPWGTGHIGAINDRGDGTLMLGSGSHIYRRTALSWVLDDTNPQRTWSYDIWGSGANDVWSLDEYGKIWRYDGAGWSVAGPEKDDYLSDGFAAAPDFGIVVGSYGMVVRWDGAQLWDMFPGQSYRSATALRGVWATSATEAFTVGSLPQGVAALKRTAAGYEQMLAPNPSFRTSMYGIWGSSATDIYAVGQQGTILHYDGTAWSDTSTSLTTASLNDIWGRSATDIWIAGSGNTTLHYDGTSWQLITAPTPNGLLGVGGDATRTFAVGNRGVILRLEGTTWVDDGPTNTTSSFGTIWVRAGSDPLIAGLGGLKRRTAPNTWVDVDYPTELGNYIQGISGPASRIVLVGSGGYAEGTLAGGFTSYPERALPGTTGVWATADQTLVVNVYGAMMVEE